MLHLSDVFPFYDSFVLLDTIVIWVSVVLFVYFIYLKHRLVIWLKNDDDDKLITEDEIYLMLKTEDEIYLILAQKGIKNSFLAYAYSSVVYLIFYVFK